jgi:hypothetical protein
MSDEMIAVNGYRDVKRAVLTLRGVDFGVVDLLGSSSVKLLNETITEINGQKKTILKLLDKLENANKRVAELEQQLKSVQSVKSVVENIDPEPSPKVATDGKLAMFKKWLYGVRDGLEEFISDDAVENARLEPMRVDPAKAESVESVQSVVENNDPESLVCDLCGKVIQQGQRCKVVDKELCTDCYGSLARFVGGNPEKPVVDNPLINIREDEDLNVLMAGGYDVGNIHFYNGHCRRMFIDAFVKIRQFGVLTVQEWAKKVKLPERIDWKGVPGCHGASDLYIDNVLITRLAKDQVEALQPLLCYRKAVLDVVEDATHSAGSGSACGGAGDESKGADTTIGVHTGLGCTLGQIVIEKEKNNGSFLIFIVDKDDARHPFKPTRNSVPQAYETAEKAREWLEDYLSEHHITFNKTNLCDFCGTCNSRQ